MNQPRTQLRWPRRTTRAGFTLVEVLMGVLILALALLGLAAVFPVVAREQRLARESIGAGSLSNSLDSFLRNSDIFRRPPDLTTGGAVSVRYGWDLLLNDQNWSRERIVRDSATGRDLVFTSWRGASIQGNGAAQFSSNSGSFKVGLAQRLWPQRSTTQDTPLFVWDLVAKRATGGDPAITTDDTGVIVAAFIRRVDPSIRVPSGSTVREQIEGGAVAAVAMNGAGAPTFDGRGQYALPAIIGVNKVGFSDVTKPRNVVTLKKGVSPDSATIRDDYTDVFALAMQVGQKLVASNGDVYTVEAAGPVDDTYAGVATAGGNYVPKKYEVIVSPALTAATLEYFRLGELNFVFTPQIPADVLVREYRR
jgi:prepilin-type N-terminal cleavage/methylation domain-containing protein